jgi:hypothetical protein
MDAGGKDSTIRHLTTGVNPAGFQVSAFSQPSAEELAARRGRLNGLPNQSPPSPEGT